MASSDPGRPPAPRTFLDWLRPQAGPLTLIPIVLLAGYHLMWIISGARYDPALLLVVIGVAVAADLAIAVAGAMGLAEPLALKVVLLLASAASAIIGLIVYCDVDDPRLAGTVKIAGVVGLLVGLLATLATIALKTDGSDQTTEHPRHVEERAVALETEESTAVFRTFRGFGGRGIDRITNAVKSELSVADLHYVAYHMDGLCRFSLDLLGDENVPADDRVSSDQRRTQYLRHGLRLSRLMKSLDQEFLSIDSGRLIRVVLDVERGALYYFRVDESRFLIGVTMDQSQVHTADQKMVRLVDTILPILGHKRIEDLNR